MEVAVVSSSEAAQAVGFEELYNEYLSTFQLDSDVPNKSPEAMVAYAGQPEVKEKWNKIKAFLMEHRYKSWNDAYLSLERIYRSVVNGTGIKCGKRYTTKKGPHHVKQTITCSNGCGFKAVLGCSSDGLWKVLEAGDLTQHRIECFCVPYQNSDMFMKYVRTHYSMLDGAVLEQKLLRTFNIKLSPHSFQQGNYASKRKHEEVVLAEKAKSFQKEEFERLFNTSGILNGVPLGDDVCALFGLLTEFKKEDPGFNIHISFDRGVLNFLGLLWSSQKAMLGLFGDLLIVDSIHGFTSYGYHVINVTLVDNTLCSQFGAIGVIRSESKESYRKFFDFVKSEVCLSDHQGP